MRCRPRLPVQVEELVRHARRSRAAGPPERPTVLTAPDPPDAVERIEQLRRDNKWFARRIAIELVNQGVRVGERTVSRWPARLGIDRCRFPDPGGSAGRRPSKRIVARQHHRHGHAGEKAAGHGTTAHRQPG
ncbi:transposase [Streptomyces viridosporus ATCC 14672]|uniref:Transposase n=1 Tax=Streptomyces viridosporus (strain ATCC 14672 / DSM 40746 / JCM 4963 / KCTC 9882 / NRRL B-12104 / FH 1290) TaxID=566461 RepID=D5ZSP9_STRV1|nr:transposase [Streptomyces viridosporus ATCC 14672]